MAPKYYELSNVLMEKIRAGYYPVGSKLPTEAELSAHYNVSRQTIRLALSVLVQKKIIEKRQGSGNKVVSAGLENEVRSVAIIASNTKDYIFPSILLDIQAVLSKSGFSSHIFATNGRLGLEREALHQVLRQPFSGVLAEGLKTALPNPNVDLYQRLIKNGIPLVFFHSGYEELAQVPCVCDDNYNGGYQLARYLISKGHDCIGAVLKSDDIQGRQRYHGYVSAMQDAGLSVPDEKILWYSTEDRNAVIERHDTTLLRSFAKSRLEGCTALIMHNDEMAYFMMLVLLDAGYDVPGGISLVSFDNSFYCGLSPVPLTSLSHDSAQLGTAAAEHLISVMNGRQAASVSVPWKLIERQSG